MRLIATIAVVLLFALIAMLVISTALAARELKQRFPAVWAAEGEPEAWLWLQRTSVRGGILSFLDERRYLAAKDERYSRYCAYLRLGWHLFFLALLAVASFVVLAAFSDPQVA